MSADVDSPAAEEQTALSDFIMVGTDNAASRHRVQKISLKYGAPLISAGVNITVAKDEDGGRLLVDRSGEVIAIRLGDGYRLNCLGRIRQADMACESHPEPEVRKKTLALGHVGGALVREPAVKTLNAMVAALAVESLVNQYDENMVREPVVVVESHDGARMCPDKSTFAMLETGCASCL
ncbi:MAG: ThiF family adenylyltransferase [Deltaproteobacteria bacterium]|nr:ThiF family adenylyltransferase [Deltaproteobacteria bacterium]